MEELGYSPVIVPLSVLRRLYPLCREAGFNITVTLVHREHDWVLTDVGPEDQTRQHYALAVDYGSTNIVMQLVDMESGCVIGEEKRLTVRSPMVRTSSPGSPSPWRAAEKCCSGPLWTPSISFSMR